MIDMTFKFVILSQIFDDLSKKIIFLRASRPMGRQAYPTLAKNYFLSL